MERISPTVYLRAMEPEDLDALYQIENDPVTWDIGTSNVPYSRYTLYEYIANAKNDIYTDKQVRLIIEDDSHNVAGIIDLINFDPKHLHAEIGIVIKLEYQKRGIGFAAIEQMKNHASNILHLHQLYAYISVDNEGSLNLFEKCGFTVAATSKDWLFNGKKYRDAVLMQFFL